LRIHSSDHKRLMPTKQLNAVAQKIPATLRKHMQITSKVRHTPWIRH
jgi:hypothetical protein